MPSKKRSRTTEDNPTSMVCDCGFEANIAMHENSPAHQRRLKMTAATPRPVTLFFPSVPAVEALPDDVVMDQDAADEDPARRDHLPVHTVSGWKDLQWPSPFASHYPWMIHSDRKFERKCLWTATSSGNFFSRNCTRFVSEPGQPCDACSGLASLDKLTALRERASCKSSLVGHKHATWTPHQLLTALKEAQGNPMPAHSLGMHKHLPE
ncbi:hypothetical protein BC831DRAFT_443366 [Entophlyctis helioformis]|nr:hypothetical protein BC831DRAFT_443366 [Entophlyctis helioformis]